VDKLTGVLDEEWQLWDGMPFTGCKEIGKIAPRDCFESGGYYSVRLGRLLVVVLNTLLYSNRSTIPPTIEDPYMQWAWFKSQLQQNCNVKGVKVYIIGHLPPGFNVRCQGGSPERTTTWDRTPKDTHRYMELVQLYADCIEGQFFGSLSDTFRLPRMNASETWILPPVPQNAEHLETLMLSPGAASPSSSQNPRYRYYTIDLVEWRILNYHSYVKRLDLTPDGSHPFELQYQAKDQYKQWGLDDISVASMGKMLRSLWSNKTAFQTWFLWLCSACFEFPKLLVNCL